MDMEHRLGFIGIGAAALTLAATQFDLLPLSFADLNPFDRAEKPEVTESGQRMRELMFEKRFDIGPGGTLAVELADADVTVRAANTDRATVSIFMSARDRDWGRDVYDRMNFETALTGSELSVVSDHPRFDRSEWRDDRGGVSFHVEIDVPASIDANITTGDGDVSMENLEGSFDLKTSDGDISVGDLTGRVFIETSDGDVSAGILTGETISVRTSDGDVRINDLAGPARISTSDGDITVGIGGSGDLTLRTGDGDITIYADETLRANLDFNGESVELAPGFTLDNGRVSEYGIEGHLNGGGPVIQVQTGDGSITMLDRERRR